ncbi:MAG: hypothetical protein JW891_07820 [Candidatus Lokiarchaeota archaeon]|nr:hypothetical protein [Candidatus Lokiarchaeota archaeon]
MKLYKVEGAGKLTEIYKLDLIKNDVYLVDDDNTIYIWVGLEVPQLLKEITAELARKLDKERGGSAKILIMKQNREYGSFLSLMDQFKKGIKHEKDIKRRPELKLEEPNLVKWLNQLKKYRKPAPELKYVVFKEGYPLPDDIEEPIEENDQMNFEEQINVAAYYLSREGYDYNELCWILAEKIMKHNLRLASIEDIRKKAEEVFKSSSSYDELCWLIAEIDILEKLGYLKVENYPIFQ